jgi:hypothetical protein
MKRRSNSSSSHGSQSTDACPEAWQGNCGRLLLAPDEALADAEVREHGRPPLGPRARLKFHTALYTCVSNAWNVRTDFMSKNGKICVA